MGEACWTERSAQSNWSQRAAPVVQRAAPDVQLAAQHEEPNWAQRWKANWASAKEAVLGTATELPVSGDSVPRIVRTDWRPEQRLAAWIEEAGPARGAPSRIRSRSPSRSRGAAARAKSRSRGRSNSRKDEDKDRYPVRFTSPPDRYKPQNWKKQ